MPVEIVMPKLGLNMTEGVVTSWLKKEGEPVRKGEPLFVVETDKVTIEVEAPADGVLGKIFVPVGERVPVRRVLALLFARGEEPMHLESHIGSEVEIHEGSQVKTRESQAADLGSFGSRGILASPRARRLAREHGVDLMQVQQAAGGRRISSDDVERFVTQRATGGMSWQAGRAPAVRGRTTSGSSVGRVASPVARKLAQKHGVDLEHVRGSGAGGRITREDVERYLAETATSGPGAPLPESEAKVTPTGHQEDIGETVPITGVRAVIAERLTKSLQSTAQFTLHSQIDATRLVEYRQHLKEKETDGNKQVPSYNAILVWLVGKALREHPYLNAREVGEAIQLLKQVNIGVAVDTPAGLVVTVVRSADQKTPQEIEAELTEKIGRAKQGKSTPDDLSGSTFTVTNLGYVGVDAFTPILNPPEVGILGVGRIREQLVIENGKVATRHQVTLSLTVDHRLVDGAPAARFLQRLAEMIANLQ